VKLQRFTLWGFGPGEHITPSENGVWVRHADLAPLLAALEKAEGALKELAEFRGKTLIGEGRYDEGAHDAFEQMAGLAAAFLAQLKAVKGE